MEVKAVLQTKKKRIRKRRSLFLRRHPRKTLVTPSSDDGNISTDVDSIIRWVYKLSKPQLQSEINKYGKLRAELVRLARDGIAKSPFFTFAPTEYVSASRATGNEILPNNENVQSKTGTEMEVIREMLGLPPTATFEEVKNHSLPVATRATTSESTLPRGLSQNSEYELMTTRNVQPSYSLPRQYYEFPNTQSAFQTQRFYGRRDTDAISFLERLHELMDAYEYLPPSYIFHLDDGILKRTQGDGELFKQYFVALSTLIRGRGGF
ncbi:hypothetical protein J6590_008999 [Homalodisca vitripennis]|nr:hypothetical protein J6590_008999 [Homalodisca vitripennis]